MPSAVMNSIAGSKLVSSEVVLTMPVHRTSASTAPATATSVTINKPTGTIAGDVMLAVISANSATTTITSVPTDWQLIESNNTVSTGGIMAVYYKIAGGSEPANYTWNINQSVRVLGGISTFYNVDTTDPIHTHISNLSGGTTSHTASAITTTINETLLVFTASADTASVYTWTVPTNYTEAFTTGGAGNILLAYDEHPTAGGSGTPTAVATSNAASTVFLIALTPSSSAPVTTTTTTLAPTTTTTTTVSTTTTTTSAALAVTFRSSSTTNTVTSTDIVLNKPAGTVENDFMLALFFGNNTPRTVTSVPSGWTLLDSAASGAGGISNMYYKIAGSSEPSSYTWVLSTSDDIAGGISTFYNVSTTKPINQYSMFSNNAGSGSTHEGRRIYTTQNDGMAIWASTADSSTQVTYTLPAGYTQAFQNTSSRTCVMAYKAMPTAGSTGAVSGSASAATAKTMFMVSLRAAGKPGGQMLHWEDFEHTYHWPVGTGEEWNQSFGFEKLTSPAKNGTYIGKFELRDGAGMADDYPRSEVRYPSSYNGSERWTSFWIRFPSANYASDNDPEIFHQTHQTSATSPPLSLRVLNDEIIAEINGQVFTGVLGDGSGTLNYTIGTVPIPKDVWTKFVIQYKFSYNTDGIWKIWVNDVLELDYAGKTIYPPAITTNSCNFKYGIYKWPWSGTGSSNTTTRMLYWDDVKLGDGDCIYSEM